MSGGSFEYVSIKDADEIVSSYGMQEQVKEMAEELDRFGASDAAEATREVLRRSQGLLSTLQDDLDRIQPVWKAVEWWRSGDWGEERLHEALTALRAS